MILAQKTKNHTFYSGRESLFLVWKPHFLLWARIIVLVWAKNTVFTLGEKPQFQLAGAPRRRAILFETLVENYTQQFVNKDEMMCYLYVFFLSILREHANKEPRFFQ